MSRVFGQGDTSTNDAVESTAPGAEVPFAFWQNLNDLVHETEGRPRHCRWSAIAFAIGGIHTVDVGEPE